MGSKVGYLMAPERHLSDPQAPLVRCQHAKCDSSYIESQWSCHIQPSFIAETLDDCIIGLLLAVLLLLWQHLLGCLSGKELLLTLQALLASLLLGKVRICDGLEVSTTKIHLGASGDAISLVHSLQWHTIEGKGTCDQEQATLQLLQENNALSSELAGQQDQDLTRLDVLAQLWGLLLNGWLHLLHSLPWWNNTMERWNWTALASNNLSPLNYCRMFLSSQHCFPSDKGNCVSLPLPFSAALKLAVQSL